jgi:hypothetical protein
MSRRGSNDLPLLFGDVNTWEKKGGLIMEEKLSNVKKR